MKFTPAQELIVERLLPLASQGLRTYHTVRHSVLRLLSLKSLYLNLVRRERFQTRIERMPSGRAVVILTHENSRAVLTALRDMKEAGRAPSRVLTLSEKLDRKLTRAGIPSSLSRDMNMDLHQEVAIHNRGHAFLAGVRAVLDGASREGMGFGDLLRVHLYFLDILLRRAERDIRACWNNGEDVVVVVASGRTDYALGLRAMTLRMTGDWQRSVGTSFFAISRWPRRLPPWFLDYLHRQDLKRFRKFSKWVRHRIERAWPGWPSLRPGEVARFLLEKLPWASLILPRSWDGAIDTTDRILIVTDSEPGTIYWRALAPVVETLARQERGINLHLGSRHAAFWAANRGLDYRMVGKLSSEARNCRNIAAQLREICGHPAAFAVKSSAHTPAEYGLAVAVAGCNVTATVLAGCVAEAVQMVRRMTRQLPRSVVAMPHWTMTANSALVAARRVGIPSVSFPSVTVSGDRWSIVDWSMDIIGCYGSQCADAFVAVGHPREQLVLVGNAAMDRLYGLDEATTRSRLTKKHGLAFEKKIVLVATTHIHDDESDFINALADACRARGDAIVMVKPHYNYSKKDYQRVRRGPHVRMLFKTDIYDLVSVCTVCVTDMSTVGAEAVIMGKPLMVVNLTGKQFVANRYDRYGIALAATSLDEIPTVLNRILDGPSQQESLAMEKQRFFDAFNHGHDGKAAERVADLAADPWPALAALVEAHPDAVSPALIKRIAAKYGRS